MSRHVISRTAYFVVFGLLLVLLAATVLVAMIPLGDWSVAVALSIAALKAALIILYFMHVRHSPELVQVFSVAGFVWLALLFVFLFSDYLTRYDVTPLTG